MEVTEPVGVFVYGEFKVGVWGFLLSLVPTLVDSSLLSILFE